MYDYKVTNIVFNDGTEIAPGSLTILLGPNNAGKSRALKDIAAYTTSYDSPSSVIVNDVRWTLPRTLQELREAYDVERFQEPGGNWSFRALMPTLCSEIQTGSNPWPSWHESVFESHENSRLPFFAQQFGSSLVAFLTTEHRLQLVKESPSQSHERQASNLLQMLFNEGRTTEENIRKVVKQAFNREVALDFTTLQLLLLRVGESFSALPPDPRDARPYMQQAEKLDEQGDGIRSFVGIVVALLSLRRSLFLIDEPEAFLHPPQAFRMGAFLAEQARKVRQIIVATHSADLLRGVLSKSMDVNILRIDRNGNTNKFNCLDPQLLRNVVNDPLLSSARVLDGLFYTGAVVVEADSDARFYQATSNKRKPDSDIHFVNADNKQTVPRISKMYRSMGVSCAGIVDFDVLNNRAEFEKQLDALELSADDKAEALQIQADISHAAKETPPHERLDSAEKQLTELLATVKDVQRQQFETDQQMVAAKERLLRQIESRSRELGDATKPWRLLKQEGRNALPYEVQLQFDRLAELCALHGLIINPRGELESMLVEYGIPSTTDKRGWILQALQLLPDLEINDEKNPWKLIKRMQNQLLGVEEDG